MPTFKYVAVNLQKKKFRGLFIAEDEKDLALQLTKQNLYLVKAKVYKAGATPSSFFTLGTGKVSLSELTTFCRQFAIMTTTGIPLLDCVDILKQQPYTAYFKSILQVISEDIKGGDMFSTALNKHKKVFPDFFRSMVVVGEASGKLDRVFIALADYYEFDSQTKRKVKGALAYPAMLAMMTVGVSLAMLLFVVPMFKDTLAQMSVEPVGIAKVVFDLSGYLMQWWQVMIMSVIIVGLIVWLFFRSETGKKALDVLKIKTPMIGKIQINTITARFARSFSLLLESGMDLASALDSTSIILGNSYIEKRFKEAANEVRQGVTMTNAFQKQKIFPTMLIQMLAVGERTAALEEVLNRSCAFFDEQVESSLASFTSKIQPVMLAIMGGVIGTLFIAIYSPMLSIMQTL